jgi:hypothetical protein
MVIDDDEYASCIAKLEAAVGVLKAIAESQRTLIARLDGNAARSELERSLIEVRERALELDSPGGRTCPVSGRPADS